MTPPVQLGLPLACRRRILAKLCRVTILSLFHIRAVALDPVSVLSSNIVFLVFIIFLRPSDMPTQTIGLARKSKSPAAAHKTRFVHQVSRQVKRNFRYALLVKWFFTLMLNNR